MAGISVVMGEIVRRDQNRLSYRSFVVSGFCLILNPSTSDHLSSSYTPEIKHDFPSQQHTNSDAFVTYGNKTDQPLAAA
jgi:hypothetical protein